MASCEKVREAENFTTAAKLNDDLLVGRDLSRIFPFIFGTSSVRRMRLSREFKATASVPFHKRKNEKKLSLRQLFDRRTCTSPRDCDVIGT